MKEEKGCAMKLKELINMNSSLSEISNYFEINQKELTEENFFKNMELSIRIDLAKIIQESLEINEKEVEFIKAFVLGSEEQKKVPKFKAEMSKLLKKLKTETVLKTDLDFEAGRLDYFIRKR